MRRVGVEVGEVVASIDRGVDAAASQGALDATPTDVEERRTSSTVGWRWRNGIGSAVAVDAARRELA